VPRALTVDSANDVLVTGVIVGATDFGLGPVVGQGGEDAFVIKVSP
jgi:hypothetical protein